MSVGAEQAREVVTLVASEAPSSELWVETMSRRAERTNMVPNAFFHLMESICFYFMWKRTHFSIA